MCKVNLIQMQDFGILKDIFTKIKCHTANLSLFNIRNYIKKYRKFFSRKFLREMSAPHNISGTQQSLAAGEQNTLLALQSTLDDNCRFPCLLLKSTVSDPRTGILREQVTILREACAMRKQNSIKVWHG